MNEMKDENFKSASKTKYPQSIMMDMSRSYMNRQDRINALNLYIQKSSYNPQFIQDEEEEDDETESETLGDILFKIFTIIFPNMSPWIWFLMHFIMNLVIVCVSLSSLSEPNITDQILDPKYNRDFIFGSIYSCFIILFVNIASFSIIMIIHAFIQKVILEKLLQPSALCSAFYNTVDPEIVYLFWSAVQIIYWRSNMILKNGPNENGNYYILRIFGYKDTDNPFMFLSTIHWYITFPLLLYIVFAARSLFLSIISFTFELGFLMNAHDLLERYLRKYGILRRFNIEWFMFIADKQENIRSLFGHELYQDEKVIRQLETNDISKQFIQDKAELLLFKNLPRNCTCCKISLNKNKHNAMKLLLPSVFEPKNIVKSEFSSIKNWLACHYVVNTHPILFLLNNSISLTNKESIKNGSDILFRQIIMSLKMYYQEKNDTYAFTESPMNIVSFEAMPSNRNIQSIKRNKDHTRVKLQGSFPYQNRDALNSHKVDSDNRTQKKINLENIFNDIDQDAPLGNTYNKDHFEIRENVRIENRRTDKNIKSSKLRDDEDIYDRNENDRKSGGKNKTRGKQKRNKSINRNKNCDIERGNEKSIEKSNLIDDDGVIIPSPILEKDSRGKKNKLRENPTKYEHLHKYSKDDEETEVNNKNNVIGTLKTFGKLEKSKDKTIDSRESAYSDKMQLKVEEKGEKSKESITVEGTKFNICITPSLSYIQNMDGNKKGDISNEASVNEEYNNSNSGKNISGDESIKISDKFGVDEITKDEEGYYPNIENYKSITVQIKDYTIDDVLKKKCASDSLHNCEIGINETYDDGKYYSQSKDNFLNIDTLKNDKENERNELMFNKDKKFGSSLFLKENNNSQDKNTMENNLYNLEKENNSSAVGGVGGINNTNVMSQKMPILKKNVNGNDLVKSSRQLRSSINKNTCIYNSRLLNDDLNILERSDIGNAKRLKENKKTRFSSCLCLRKNKKERFSKIKKDISLEIDDPFVSNFKSPMQLNINGNEFITKEMIEVFLKPDETDEFMKEFDLSGHGKIDIIMFRTAIKRAIACRKKFIKSLKGKESILKLVRRLMSILMSFLASVVLLFIFGVSADTIIVTGAAFITAITVILSYMYTSFITSVIFIAFSNPYNIGDRIRLDGGEAMYIKKIKTYTTEFETTTGKIVIYENSKLSNAKIYNESRSKNAYIDISFKVDINTPLLALKELRKSLQFLVDSRPSDFCKTKNLYFGYSLQPGHFYEISFWIKCVEGWGNWRKVFELRTDIYDFIILQLRLLSISYRLPTQKVGFTAPLNVITNNNNNNNTNSNINNSRNKQGNYYISPSKDSKQAIFASEAKHNRMFYSSSFGKDNDDDNIYDNNLFREKEKYENMYNNNDTFFYNSNRNVYPICDDNMPIYMNRQNKNNSIALNENNNMDISSMDKNENGLVNRKTIQNFRKINQDLRNEYFGNSNRFVKTAMNNFPNNYSTYYGNFNMYTEKYKNSNLTDNMKKICGTNTELNMQTNCINCSSQETKLKNPQTYFLENTLNNNNKDCDRVTELDNVIDGRQNGVAKFEHKYPNLKNAGCCNIEEKNKIKFDRLKENECTQKQFTTCNKFGGIPQGCYINESEKFNNVYIDNNGNNRDNNYFEGISQKGQYDEEYTEQINCNENSYLSYDSSSGYDSFECVKHFSNLHYRNIEEKNDKKIKKSTTKYSLNKKNK
ncbi:ion channel protein, putative [Plasmodium berghei]|uniref:Mechanosensitive ion channel protein, putative n=2 Tax=Plasmodium berghei TaxID=5821 RepID=A0A509AK67_PLABA|nr:mechanosensitive ion channel protein, putative [Plasmodium berghei ANKA]CXI46084.1 ion channel protein, putative [Plasmodium berghei]SCM22747.1 ion channel protein, putative [Plasmodium berghei]SCN25650.1 ion channel protein, putative [Plasmodium berghei]SCO60584.1 ion channel protein, putative [Plasmodium berghei]SCO62325.1 ion channel protein, putative [Plasmodium berghei]|eukprot:XP_034421742.1 mechanosensitive ion channel protein, putative [Plasmodium berghei ANKA]